MMTNEFTPTHVIILDSGDRIEVQLVDGAAYTRAEWNATDSADYERQDNGEWTFQGQPFAGTVEVIATSWLDKMEAEELKNSGLTKEEWVAMKARVRASAEEAEWLKPGARVKAGYGADLDTGRIESLDGDMAYVAWDSGVKTECPVQNLRKL